MPVEKTISIPKKLFDKLLQHSASLADAHEQLEDFYIAKNQNVIKKLRKARREHLEGKVIPFSKLKKKYV